MLKDEILRFFHSILISVEEEQHFLALEMRIYTTLVIFIAEGTSIAGDK